MALRTLTRDGGEGMTGVDSRENERIALGDSKCNQFLQGGLFHRGAEKQGYSYKRKYNPGRVF